MDPRLREDDGFMGISTWLHQGGAEVYFRELSLNNRHISGRSPKNLNSLSFYGRRAAVFYKPD